ncbi:GNAT family N-acetyltransferase [Streptomyces jumonjinensis]|uniref:GNAT family N-acetyltransferase n=1 Tax=Streptomyces jumonjinensis TaxID=1945 RepID=A0A646K9U4_STRJU|nr:GNAT family N-acetyltransferase [Streptomyces jumonjinensis]MQS98923.1 GNAT family N-acetyltransferase [Streptomyces jumonjinensis]
MRAEIFVPGAGAAPDGWDPFVRACRAPVLWEAPLLEAAAWASTRPLYAALVRDAGEPVAAFCGRLGVWPLAQRFGPPGRPVTPGWFQTHLPNSFGGGRLHAEALTTAARRASVRAFERALRRELGVRCLGVLHLDVLEHELADLTGPFRHHRPVAPSHVLRTRWDSMDRYFAELPRNRRRRLTALYERVGSDPELEVATAVPAIDPVRASRLDQLTRMKHSSRPGRVAPLPAGYFERLNERSGAVYFAHLDKGSGRPVSFDLVLDTPGGWATTVTGSAEGVRDLYFDLYLREIEHLIATGVPAVDFGPGMRELKESFGCELLPRHAVIAPFAPG